jgi:hypothetical protein
MIRQDRLDLVIAVGQGGDYPCRRWESPKTSDNIRCGCRFGSRGADADVGAVPDDPRLGQFRVPASNESPTTASILGPLWDHTLCAIVNDLPAY